MEFQVGDEVEYECSINKDYCGVGEVVRIHERYTWPYEVRFRDSRGSRMFDHTELTLIDDGELEDWI